MARSATHAAIEAVFRIEWPKLIAGLTRVVRDVGVAEELAHDALVAALEQWPNEGIPDKPGAWLMATAKHRAIDTVRRAKLVRRKHEELGGELEALGGEVSDEREAIDEALDDEIGDDMLSLMFVACHPVLAMEARVALTLRMVGGLTTAEIARAFLVPEPTIAQRIVRAKRTLVRGARAVRGAARRGARRAARVGARGRLPRVQRRLFGDGRRRLAAARALRRRAAARAHARRARAGRARGPRARRAARDPGVAQRRADAARTASPCCCSSRTAAAGTAC